MYRTSFKKNVFTQPFHMSRMQYKVSFIKQCLVGLNSEFFHSKTGSHAKVKELVYPAIYPYLEGE